MDTWMNGWTDMQDLFCTYSTISILIAFGSCTRIWLWFLLFSFYQLFTFFETMPTLLLPWESPPLELSVFDPYTLLPYTSASMFSNFVSFFIFLALRPYIPLRHTRTRHGPMFVLGLNSLLYVAPFCLLTGTLARTPSYYHPPNSIDFTVEIACNTSGLLGPYSPPFLFLTSPSAPATPPSPEIVSVSYTEVSGDTCRWHFLRARLRRSFLNDPLPWYNYDVTYSILLSLSSNTFLLYIYIYDKADIYIRFFLLPYLSIYLILILCIHPLLFLYFAYFYFLFSSSLYSSN